MLTGARHRSSTELGTSSTWRTPPPVSELVPWWCTTRSMYASPSCRNLRWSPVWTQRTNLTGLTYTAVERRTSARLTNIVWSVHRRRCADPLRLPPSHSSRVRTGRGSLIWDAFGVHLPAGLRDAADRLGDDPRATNGRAAPEPDLGPGHRDGPQPRDHRGDRYEDLLL